MSETSSKPQSNQYHQLRQESGLSRKDWFRLHTILVEYVKDTPIHSLDNGVGAEILYDPDLIRSLWGPGKGTKLHSTNDKDLEVIHDIIRRTLKYLRTNKRLAEWSRDPRNCSGRAVDGAYPLTSTAGLDYPVTSTDSHAHPWLAPVNGWPGHPLTLGSNIGLEAVLAPLMEPRSTTTP